MAYGERSGITVVVEPHSMGIPLEGCRFAFLLSYSIENLLCHRGYNKDILFLYLAILITIMR